MTLLLLLTAAVLIFFYVRAGKKADKLPKPLPPARHCPHCGGAMRDHWYLVPVPTRCIRPGCKIVSCLDCRVSYYEDGRETPLTRWRGDESGDFS